MRGLTVCLLLALLAGCASPYQFALDSREPVRPQPPVTPADQRALDPYNTDLFD